MQKNKKFALKCMIAIISFFLIFRLFSINIQEKFNELLNSLLGGYTQSLFFGKKTVKQAQAPDYIVFDLDVKDTIGELAFIINKKNMHYIIAENSIKQLQTMQDICKKINIELQKLQEKTVTTLLLQKLHPYIKTKSNKKLNSLINIEKYKENNYSMLQSWISAFNNKTYA